MQSYSFFIFIAYVCVVVCRCSVVQVFLGQSMQGRVGFVGFVGLCSRVCRVCRILYVCMQVCIYVCMYVGIHVGMQACRYVCVCSSLYYKSFSFCCCLANRLHTNIYLQTNLLPRASTFAVLAEEDHSCNSRALGLLVHCATCYSSFSRLRLSFLLQFLSLVSRFEMPDLALPNLTLNITFLLCMTLHQFLP